MIVGIIFLCNTLPGPPKKKKLDWHLGLEIAQGALLKLCSISAFSRFQCAIQNIDSLLVTINFLYILTFLQLIFLNFIIIVSLKLSMHFVLLPLFA